MEENYCVMGTCVRTGYVVQISSYAAKMTAEEAEKAKEAFQKAFDLIENKDYTMYDLYVEKAPFPYYRIQHNVGNVKYLLIFHDGVKRHEDGSICEEIRCFSNKMKLEKYCNTLSKKGYKLL